MTLRLRPLCVGLLLASGCANAPRPVIHTVLEPTATRVRVVVHEPARGKYRFVGKVNGEALTDDTLAAAECAKNDIRNKAAALGADLVKIDEVSAPDDSGQIRRVVIFSGRAFKERGD